MTVLDNLPWTYRTDPWIIAMAGAIDGILSRQETEAEETADQILLDAITWNLSREEQLAGIVPPSGATLEDRRSTLAAKWRSGGKIGVDQIQSVADAWRDGQVDVLFESGHIVITFSGEYGVPSDLNGLKSAVSLVAPAHLMIEYRFRYLLVREVATMTVSTLGDQTINKFAFGGTL